MSAPWVATVYVPPFLPGSFQIVVNSNGLPGVISTELVFSARSGMGLLPRW